MILEPVHLRTSRTVCQDVNSQDNFKVEVPTRNSSTSSFTSPIISPPRISSGDFFPYYYITPKANQIWSAPEMPTGVPLPMYPDYVTFSSENSPLQSPQMKSPHQGSSKSISGLSPISRRESSPQASVHPLPLPPGAAMPSPLTSGPHVATKPESLPLKSQWQKGKLIGRGTFGSVYVASNL